MGGATAGRAINCSGGVSPSHFHGGTRGACHAEGRHNDRRRVVSSSVAAVADRGSQSGERTRLGCGFRRPATFYVDSPKQTSFPRFGFPGFPRSAFSPFTYLSRRSLGVGGPVRIHHVLRRLKRLRVKPQRAIYANRSAFCFVFPPRHKFDRTYSAPKVFAEAKSSIDTTSNSEPLAISTNRAKSTREVRELPSAMFDEMETAARRIWLVKPKRSSEENVPVNS